MGSRTAHLDFIWDSNKCHGLAGLDCRSTRAPNQGFASIEFSRIPSSHLCLVRTTTLLITEFHLRSLIWVLIEPRITRPLSLSFSRCISSDIACKDNSVRPVVTFALPRTSGPRMALCRGFSTIHPR